MLRWAGNDQPMKMRETSRAVDKKLRVNNIRKTSLACLAVAQAQLDEPEKESVLIDLEQAFNPNWAQTLGVDLSMFQVSQPNTYAEKVYDFIEFLIKTGKYAYIILDSADGLVTKDEMENDDWEKESRVGGTSKLNSKAMRKIVNTGLLRESGTTLLIIQQLRDKIGGFSMYGTPTTTSGGRSFRHNSTQTLEVSRGDSYTQGTGQARKYFGQQLRFKVSKNKIAPPFRSGSIDLYYESGVDRVAELVNVSKAIGVLQGSSWIKVLDPATGEVWADEQGNELKWHGLGKFIDDINADIASGGDMYARLYSIVQEVIRG